MQITDIKSVSKTKFKVYLDGQFAFTLYKGELFRYRIQEDGELSEEVYQEIREKVVLKRAKTWKIMKRLKMICLSVF